MQDLTAQILELVRLAATDLPSDVEKSLEEAAVCEEPGSAARGALETILDNVALSRQNSTPICQDTGIVTAFVKIGMQCRFDTDMTVQDMVNAGVAAGAVGAGRESKVSVAELVVLPATAKPEVPSCAVTDAVGTIR